MDSFYQSFSSLFSNHLEVHSRWYKKLGSCAKGSLVNIGIADNWQESQSLGIATQFLDKSSIQNLLSISAC